LSQGSELKGMKKLIAFILWPALAGLVFALTLLQAPRLVSLMPGLEDYLLPMPQVQAVNTQPSLSYRAPISKAAPAVVSINYQQIVERTAREYVNPFVTRIRTYYDDSNSLGSGVIISPEGFIVSSYHVFFGPETGTPFSPDISVTLNDGRTIEARMVSLDEKNDLALLKVDVEDLPYLDLADTSALRVGDVVLAIGNPRNIGQSVSFGIISALWRRDDSFVIQTDAAINPGNSGGALINSDGDLIGINSTIVSESGGSEGISFAIPADKAIRLLDEFLASGPGGYLGVDTSVLTLDEGRQYFSRDVEGFLINEVTLNSPADKAGLRVKDVITGVNETKLVIRDERDTTEAFKAISAISSLPPGELIMIEVFRDGGFLQLPTILGIGVPKVHCEDPQTRNPAETECPLDLPSPARPQIN
jgi:serine protease DegS